MSGLDVYPIQGIESGEGVADIAFSPDGRALVFWTRDRVLKRIPVGGGAAITLCEAEAPFGLSWDRGRDCVRAAHRNHAYLSRRRQARGARAREKRGAPVRSASPARGRDRSLHRCHQSRCRELEPGGHRRTVTEDRRAKDSRGGWRGWPLRADRTHRVCRWRNIVRRSHSICAAWR